MSLRASGRANFSNLALLILLLSSCYCPISAKDFSVDPIINLQVFIGAAENTHQLLRLFSIFLFEPCNEGAQNIPLPVLLIVLEASSTMVHEEGEIVDLLVLGLPLLLQALDGFLLVSLPLLQRLELLFKLLKVPKFFFNLCLNILGPALDRLHGLRKGQLLLVDILPKDSNQDICIELLGVRVAFGVLADVLVDHLLSFDCDGFRLVDLNLIPIDGSEVPVGLEDDSFEEVFGDEAKDCEESWKEDMLGIEGQLLIEQVELQDLRSEGWLEVAAGAQQSDIDCSVSASEVISGEEGAVISNDIDAEGLEELHIDVSNGLVLVLVGLILEVQESVSQNSGCFKLGSLLIPVEDDLSHGT